MKDRYHNALGGNSADQLRAYVTRLLRLEDEAKEISATKGDVYRELKACGFCKKTVRKVVLRHIKDRSEIEEEDDLLDLYEAAVLSTDQIPRAETGG